jgi:hypothetical protein
MSIGVSFQRTDGATGAQAPDPATATLATTSDDGATWVDARATSLGAGRFRFTFTNPPISTTNGSTTNGFVGLRLAASDSAANGVAQTLLRAYALR